MSDTSQPESFDTPWKEALERYLPDFMRLFFPQAFAEIDWSRGYELLDAELQQVVREAELGRRQADRLVRVARLSGDPALVYIHIEVQSQQEAGFAERMFVYHYRIRDRYGQPIVSLAVLGDDRPSWKPTGYQYALWDCALDFRFPVVKLLDYVPRRAELERERNPFATVVLAHLATQETRQSDMQRAVAKFALTRRLYTLGYDRQEIVNLYRLIDWMVKLPPGMEADVWQQIKQFEVEGHMEYITTAERIGRAEGRAEGLVEGIGAMLEMKFGQAAVALLPEIQSIDDIATLERLLQAIKLAATLDEVRAAYTAPEP
jgi:hypothetical protein